MKGKTIFIALGILLVAVITGVFTFGSYSNEIVTLGGDQISTKYIEVPRFCYLACQPTQTVGVTKIMKDVGDDKFGQKSISDVNVATPYTCKQFLGLVERCTMTFKVTNGNLDGFATNAQLDYQKVDLGGVFSENTKTTVPNGVAGYDNNEFFTIELFADEVLWVRYAEGFASFSNTWKKVDGKVSINAVGTPYAIYQYDSLSSTNGQRLIGQREGTCYVEDNFFQGSKIDFADPGIKELNNQEKYFEYQALNEINGRFTYECGFTTVPNFDSKVEFYDNQAAYCLNNQMYSINQISFGGQQYSVVNYDASGSIGSVVCCNGDTRPGQVCDNHQWKDLGSVSCDLSQGKYCPQSTYQPYGDSQYKRFACVDNQCVEDVITVECNDNNDCGTGQVCVFASDPKDNYCVERGTGGSAVCGDNVCELSERDTCPNDCSSPSFVNKYFVWIIVLLSLVFLFAISLIIVYFRGKK